MYTTKQLGEKMRTFIIVIDSFGIGAMPDAYKWHDEGSNTFLHIENTVHPYLPNLTKLGLKDIDGIKIPHTSDVIGNYGRMFERSNGKDTLTGHYEMMGIIQKRPNPTFPNGFPEDLMKKIESATGYQFLGNEVASGTEIIQRLGEEHIKTGKPIVYTSADSVLQIAAHVDIVPLDKLYDLCKQIRALTAKGKYNVARVIARPFAGEVGAFYRTEDRHDFSLLPPKKSVLDKMKKKGYDVISIGKINDVFCGQGITESIPTKNNTEGLNAIIETTKRDFNGIVFANLCDTDMLYGHRNNVEGYGKALEQIDEAIPTIIDNLNRNDILIVTADHGCDPSTASTDHSREYVPILVYGKNLKNNVNLRTLFGFDQLGRAILDIYKVKKYKYSFLRKLIKYTK